MTRLCRKGGVGGGRGGTVAPPSSLRSCASSGCGGGTPLLLDALLGDCVVDVDGALLIRWRRLDGELKGVEGGAGVAAGHVGEVGESVVADGDGAVAVAALGVVEGAEEEVAHLLGGQWREVEQARPGRQRPDYLKERLYLPPLAPISYNPAPHRLE